MVSLGGWLRDAARVLGSSWWPAAAAWRKWVPVRIIGEDWIRADLTRAGRKERRGGNWRRRGDLLRRTWEAEEEEERSWPAVLGEWGSQSRPSPPSPSPDLEDGRKK